MAKRTMTEKRWATKATIEAAARAVWALRNITAWEEAPAYWRRRYRESSRVALVAAQKDWERHCHV